MSFSFYLPAAAPPRFSQLVDALAEPDWVCEGPEDDRFTNDFFVHPYLAGRAARGVELGLSDGTLQIRIMTCSSRADHELALRLVDTLAKMLESTIRPEDGDPISREQFSAQYGESWVEHMLASGPGVVLAMARKGQTLTLMGAKRAFYVGPRLVAELTKQGDAGFGERLLNAMVRLQSIDEEEYYTASVLVVKPKEWEADEDGVKLAVWAPNVAYLFPDVEYFAVLLPDGGHLIVPRSAGASIADDRWTFLDEKNALVEATAAPEWPALIARARPFVTELQRTARRS
ncbi:DUF4299 domain-containing protein [Pendulispora rubella]|uniref:DUF4299 domain-containing protein n=1 Tax=Pendulispora rubella TaxID=2741070 RepID=A0ABZ2LDA1_9BACT